MSCAESTISRNLFLLNRPKELIFNVSFLLIFQNWVNQELWLYLIESFYNVFYFYWVNRSLIKGVILTLLMRFIIIWWTNNFIIIYFIALMFIEQVCYFRNYNINLEYMIFLNWCLNYSDMLRFEIKKKIHFNCLLWYCSYFMNVVERINFTHFECLIEITGVRYWVY